MFTAGGLKSHPGWAFLLLKKSDLSSVSGIAASSFLVFLSVMFLHLCRIKVQRWSDRYSTPDLLKPVVETTANLLEGPFKGCCVALVQQSFPSSRSIWDPK